MFGILVGTKNILKKTVIVEIWSVLFTYIFVVAD